ncbi:hypothetical protein ACOMHN_027004 [Nucella lapillus]
MPTSSGSFNDSTSSQGSRRSRFTLRRRSTTSWWRDILNFRNEDECHDSRFLFHSGRSADPDVVISLGLDCPSAPPAYDDVPPPYSVTEPGSGGQEMTTAGGNDEPLEAPPSYSEVILLSPSSGLAGPGQPSSCE